MSESLEGIASLRKLPAKRAKCSEAVIEFILQPEEEGGLGMESVADLAGWFTKDTYEAGVVSEFLQKVGNGQLAAKPKEVSRLRMAWEVAKGHCQHEVMKEGTPSASVD